MPDVFLTYDDGPGPHTARLLDVLAAHGVKATFFLLGSNVERYPAVVERMAAEGHILGNHTYSHLWDIEHVPQFMDELRQTDELIWRAMGLGEAAERPINPFRLPGGPRPGDPRLRIITGLARSHVHWTGEFNDWEPRTAEQIFDDVRVHVERSHRFGLDAVVLLHDSAPATDAYTDRQASVDATELLLARRVVVPSERRPDWAEKTKGPNNGPSLS